MLILAIRTDKPQSELGIYNGDKQLAYVEWEAHRQLSETIHLQLKELLKSQKLSFEDVEGIVAFKGPGSYTGLRIGLSVANALANSLKVPIVGTGGKDWLKKGISGLEKGQNDQQISPEYGQDVFITKPVK